MRCRPGLSGFAAAVLCLVGAAHGTVLRGRLRRRSYRQALRNFHNVQYYADFKIGGQDIAGIVDTGSFNLIVRSTRCEACAHPTPPYDRTKSDTYHLQGLVSKVTFGAGTCHTLKGYESVSVGPLNIPRQAFWEIMDHEISLLDEAQYAAIVGLGYRPRHAENALLESFGFDEFSICLREPGGSEGVLTWGPAAAGGMTKQDFVTARVMGDHHWMTRLQNLSFVQPGGALATHVLCPGSGCAVIIDSGSPVIAAPHDALFKLSDQIDIQPDCSNIHELPALRFLLDGQPFEMPPQAYTVRVTGTQEEVDDVSGVLGFPSRPAQHPNTCLPAFGPYSQTGSEFGPVWILGMPFLRQFLTTFDRADGAMRFADVGPNCEPRPLSASGHAASLLGAAGRELGVLDVAAAAIVLPRPPRMTDVDP